MAPPLRQNQYAVTPCHSLVQANSPAICMCVCLCLKDADTQGSSGLKHGSHAVGEASRIGVGIYSTNVVAKADGLVAMLQLFLQIVGLQNVNQPNLLRWGTPTMLKLCPMVVHSIMHQVQYLNEAHRVLVHCRRVIC